MFINSTQLTTALEGLYNVSTGGLPAKFSASITAAALSAAYGAIVRALVKRGYTKDQADAWVDGAEYQTDIGMYFAIVKANSLDKIDAGVEANWTRLDRRAELIDIVILDAAYEPIVPAVTGQLVGGGRMSTARDLVVLDPDDSRIGEPTEW